MTVQSPPDAMLFAEIQQFVAREVFLLDERRFDEWLELFTDDVRYWMPVVVTADDPRLAVAGPDGLAWFDDDRESLALRVRRLRSPQAHAETPGSRTRRFASLTSVEELDSGEVCASVNFAIYRSRRERDVDVFVGGRKDVLRQTDDGWKIASRTLRLDQDIVANRDMSVFF